MHLEYLASNCTIDYDETTEVDNSLSTALTNYTIGVVGLGVALLLSLTKKKENANWFKIAFFLLSAVGYSLAGVYHHLVKHKDNEGLTMLYYISIGITVLAINFLELTLTTGKVWGTLLSLSNLAIIVALITAGQDVLAAVWSLASYVALSLLYGLRRLEYTRALGCTLFCLGFAVAGAFDGTCGSAAQKDCFRECIFPDPTSFNHNGLFHILVAMGLLFLGVAEVTDEASDSQELDNYRPQVRSKSWRNHTKERPLSSSRRKTYHYYHHVGVDSGTKSFPRVQ